VYFGSVSDPQAALEKWNREKDYRLAGEAPNRSGSMTVRELCNAFLTAKKRLIASGELTERSWSDYHTTCEKIVANLGASKPVEKITPSDLSIMRANLARDRGLVSLQSDIGRVRVVFNYGYQNGLLEKPIRYGDAFKRPSKAALRIERNKRGQKLFTAAEIRTLLEIASPQLKAMILLGINCALGNADLARMTSDKIAGEWLHYPRPKTGCERVAPLWPETLEALRVMNRPEHRKPEHAQHVFITKYGSTWEPKSMHDNPVAKEFRKLLNKVGIERKAGFYDLRHTFQTIAEQTRDKDAVRCVMGHVEATGDMSAVYSEQRPSNERLLAVANHVRAWLRQAYQENEPAFKSIACRPDQPAAADAPGTPAA
jgi:integrase